jgi:hypothetical protein
MVRGKVSSMRILLLLFAPVVASAQGDDNRNPDRFQFRVGTQIFSSFTSVFRLDSETLGLGTEIGLEDDVGLEERIQVLRLDGTYNFNRRHNVALSFYDIERTGTRLTARDIQFGDEFFPAGTPVVSSFDQQILKLSYGYNFLVRERGVLGGSFGLHNMRFGTGLQAADASLGEDASADAPLPVFGLRGHYRFAERWRLVGSIEWFDVQVGDVQGTFEDFIVSVEHDTFDRFGFGFGLNNFGLDVEAGDEDLKGIIDLSFDSVVVYVRGSWGAR